MKDRKQFAVIGLGIFGSTLATTLAERDCDVLAIDYDMSAIERINDQVTKAVCMDVTDRDALEELSLDECDAVIVAMTDHFECSVLTTLNLKELGVKKVIAKAKNKQFAKVLEKVGADQVIRVEKEMGERMAINLSRHNVVEQFDIDKEYAMVEIQALNGWAGKTIKTLDVRGTYGMNIVGRKSVNQKVGHWIMEVTADYVVEPGDSFLVVMKNSDVEKFDLRV